MECYQIKDGVLLRYTGREELLQVPEGIHTIGEGAFKGCVSLMKVVLPQGLESIQGDAFKGCRRLEEVVFPAGLRYIGRYAFHRCHALRQVFLPSSVEEVDAFAFLYCDSLREVRIPGVKRLGMEAFANGMSLEKLVISRDLDESCICDVFTGCGRVTEIAYIDDRTANDKTAGEQTKEQENQPVDGKLHEEVFRIPNVIDVAVGAFKVPRLIDLVVNDIVLRMMELEGRCLVRFRINIKHVEVPEGIEVLGKSSFYDMRGILDIRLPKSLKRIESRAFRNCIGLEQVTFGGDEVQIDEDAFRNCTSLKRIRTCGGKEYLFEGLSDIYKINQDGDSVVGVSEPVRVSDGDVPVLVRVIRRQVFGNFRISGTMLLKYLGIETRVVIPEGITMIAEEAFAGNETIDRAIFPESLREIGAEAFRGCLMMQTAVLPGGLCRIGAGAFADCVKLLRIEIPEQVRVLEERAFGYCRALQEVYLPEGLCEIGEGAFYGCLALKRIHLPKSLIKIGKMAFYRSGLREVRIPSGTTSVESLAFAKSQLQKAWVSGDGQATGKYYGAEVFGDCGRLKMLVLEEGVRHIPDKFAYGCLALERVVLPETLESVGRHALEGTVFLERWRQRMLDNQAASASDEHMFTKAWEDAIFWDGQHLEGEVQLPDAVRIVAGGAFYGNAKITAVHLPEQVQSVGAASFKGCRVLRRVWVPSGIHQLEAEVFSGCAELQEVLLTQSESYLECKKTEWLPAWYRIGERAFYRCGKLRAIRLDQVTDIGKEALWGCAALGNDRSAVNLKFRAGENAFFGTKLGETLENGLHVAGNMVVSGALCSGEVVLPETIQGVAPYAFAGNRSVCKIVFPTGIQWIGEGAFFGCSSLAEVVLLDLYTVPTPYDKDFYTIGASAFEKCIVLREIVSHACSIGEAAFAGCIALESAELSQIQVLEKRLFAGCEHLQSCLCENAVEARAYSFSGCKSLRGFDFARINCVGEYAFAGCECLKAVEFQDEVCLCPHALEDCSGLEKICLLGPQGAVCLKEYALSGCTALRQVVHLGKEWVFRRYADIFSEAFPEVVRLLFYSAFSCFVVEQEENLSGYRGAAGKVRIPQGIRRIEAEVFRDAMMLEQVEIPESVYYIGARAFHGTAWMAQQRMKSPMVVVRDMLLDGSGCAKEVTIPPGIRLVCGWAFANGLDIERICFANADECVQSDDKTGHCKKVRHRKIQVEEYAFRNCINLREIVLPDGTKVLLTGLADRERDLPPLAKQAVMDSMNCFKTDENGVLMECTGNISRLRLAQGITEIGEGAFQDGNLLTTITFAKTVKAIGKRAFAGCKWLREVLQADSVESIEAYAFSGCGALRTVELSENLRKIGARAFENCTQLESVLIPEGVEEIPERAFYRCHSLRSIQLPSTIKRIGREAFAYCEGALEIHVPDEVSVGERAFYMHSSLQGKKPQRR